MRYEPLELSRRVGSQGKHEVSQTFPSMGNIPCCTDCSHDMTDEVEVSHDNEMECTPARELFDLTDLNGDGQITAEEFAIMGLNQTKVHTQRHLTAAEEQCIRAMYVQEYFVQIDSSFKPMTRMNCPNPQNESIRDKWG